MRCPNLVKKDMHRCRTIDESYRPSQFQLWEYCKTHRHKICPFYVGYQRKQAGPDMNISPAIL